MEQNQMNNDEIEIDLREIFSVLLSHLGIIILSGLVLGLVAIVGTKVFITPQYQSVTKMYVLAKQNNDTLTSADMADQYPADKRLCRDDSEPYRYGSGYCTAGSGYDT